MVRNDLRTARRAAALLTAALFLGACSTTEEQVRAQIEVLAANDIDSPRWRAAVDELVAVGRPGARQLMELLDPAQYRGAKYREFRDEIARTRTGAAVVLGRINHRAASASMKDRITTAYAYPERLACLRGVGALGFDEATVTALQAQLADADPVIRLLASAALVKLGESASRDTILNAVRHGSDALAELAAAELEGANYHGVSILVELLAGDGPHRQRLQIALDHVREQLVHQLADDDPEVRRESAASLGDVRDASVVGALLAVLDDPSNLVRFHAASSLVRLGNEEGTSFLFSSLDSADPILRLNAVNSLVRVQRLSGLVEERLAACLTSASPRLRSGAAQVLGQAGVTAAVDELVAACRDPEPEVRWSAVLALGRIAVPAGRGALEQCVHDQNETVAYYAEWALRQLAAG